MTRIFVGIVKCGAWGCFDEFNRLEESVLSAISMQIQVTTGFLFQIHIDRFLISTFMNALYY